MQPLGSGSSQADRMKTLTLRGTVQPLQLAITDVGGESRCNRPQVLTMRRTERLFAIIQCLRAARQPVTAQVLASELETSARTIYRDIAELLAQRVPIRGEAGIGYVLDRGYDMPPLMLTPDEIEAAVLGAQWVASRGDAALARGARDLIAKIAAVVPDHLRPIAMESSLTVPDPYNVEVDAIDMAELRAAIRSRRKLQIDYRDEHGRISRRVVWPVAVAYFETVRLIVAWCELRNDFRHFRTDRIVASEFLQQGFSTSTAQLRALWWQRQQAVGNCRRVDGRDVDAGHAPRSTSALEREGPEAAC